MAGRDMANVLEGVSIEKLLERVMDKFGVNIGMLSSRSHCDLP
jgi:hypothetical protein